MGPVKRSVTPVPIVNSLHVSQLLSNWWSYFVVFK
jgi:hypothetical protein